MELDPSSRGYREATTSSKTARETNGRRNLQRPGPAIAVSPPENPDSCFLVGRSPPLRELSRGPPMDRSITWVAELVETLGAGASSSFVRRPSSSSRKIAADAGRD